ncbi:DgyrCDS5981 [Dimorphilus gyrociliatus]|uniref:DgyrCDS5981 n=1 Tax=Dimorphilus gyrociliatus TaxID=2664684 RepID=A0A7I8VLK9_9ANNE|nr:DgyrCDS5981 [Dimorphilus gyrociliatus]
MNIGKHCSLTSCKRLDFLPFPCQFCKEIFCKDHREPEIHLCSNYKSNDLEEARNKQVLGTFPCSFIRCEKKEVTEIECEICHGCFCFKHRNPLDHKCAVEESTSKRTPELKIQKQPPQVKNTNFKSAKQRNLAAKVALMKIKMSAIGNKSIPQEDRFFLNIILPESSQHSSKPFYFTKHWTIGRMIDYVASEVKLENENNKSGSSKKLCVFDGFDSEKKYPAEVELSNISDLPSGSTLIFKYGGSKFIDKLRVYVKGGKGGDGLSSFGGVGGKGGNVYVVGSETATLKKLDELSPAKRFLAEGGKKSRKTELLGRRGKSIEIPVPIGITVRLDDNSVIGEVNRRNERVLVSKGGEGGQEKNNFLGQKGEARSVSLDLKLIADIGLVGFPNAGKSTILSAISRARPRIASYPFTTLRPQLGIMQYSDLRKISIADLPGLVEGAHLNVGMGHKFLKHVERTKLLLFLVDVYGFQLSAAHPCRSAIENIIFLIKELELFNPSLLEKPAVLAINKIDLANASDQADLIAKQALSVESYFDKVPEEYVPSRSFRFDKIYNISAKERIGTEELKISLRELLDYYADKDNEKKMNFKTPAQGRKLFI